jgi:hypothetical protein
MQKSLKIEMPSREWAAQARTDFQQSHTRPPYAIPSQLLVATRRRFDSFADKCARAHPAAAVRCLLTGITAHHHRYPIARVGTPTRDASRFICEGIRSDGVRSAIERTRPGKTA